MKRRKEVYNISEKEVLKALTKKKSNRSAYIYWIFEFKKKKIKKGERIVVNGLGGYLMLPE